MRVSSSLTGEGKGANDGGAVVERKYPLTSTSKSVWVDAKKHTLPTDPPLSGTFAITKFGIVSPAAKFRFDVFGCAASHGNTVT